uniref:Uncharacterized protein n=1 Tax=Chromera velia CCMP2878 TaxID=1169474 RepID=A0A0G4GWQ2_9ALVE|eukprot:Cvel_23668.t1-p1 / transcript=Cvel_23668.t1 / gene=Cvel_23668 / organism=Chromera_velia_CCMP2878 / gene_product=hypothetical protein / transcript_product=hypothetical protein / location=Cvel_scaffold2465:18780-20957(-) / protein_length=670 / sequence_SO=supercontig / SO=protein_coding / is_pseudo=false
MSRSHIKLDHDQEEHSIRSGTLRQFAEYHNLQSGGRFTSLVFDGKTGGQLNEHEVRSIGSIEYKTVHKEGEKYGVFLLKSNEQTKKSRSDPHFFCPSHTCFHSSGEHGRFFLKIWLWTESGFQLYDKWAEGRDRVNGFVPCTTCAWKAMYRHKWPEGYQPPTLEEEKAWKEEDQKLKDERRSKEVKLCVSGVKKTSSGGRSKIAGRPYDHTIYNITTGVHLFLDARWSVLAVFEENLAANLATQTEMQCRNTGGKKEKETLSALAAAADPSPRSFQLTKGRSVEQTLIRLMNAAAVAETQMRKEATSPRSHPAVGKEEKGEGESPPESSTHCDSPASLSCPSPPHNYVQSVAIRQSVGASGGSDEADSEESDSTCSVQQISEDAEAEARARNSNDLFCLSSGGGGVNEGGEFETDSDAPPLPDDFGFGCGFGQVGEERGGHTGTVDSYGGVVPGCGPFSAFRAEGGSVGGMEGDTMSLMGFGGVQRGVETGEFGRFPPSSAFPFLDHSAPLSLSRGVSEAGGNGPLFPVDAPLVSPRMRNRQPFLSSPAPSLFGPGGGALPPRSLSFDFPRADCESRSLYGGAPVDPLGWSSFSGGVKRGWSDRGAEEGEGDGVLFGLKRGRFGARTEEDGEGMSIGGGLGFLGGLGESDALSFTQGVERMAGGEGGSLW